MTRKIQLITVIMVCMAFLATAQDDTNTSMSKYNSTPKDAWEVGVGVGAALLPGDVDSKLGFGGSLHVRKALDYIFSLRGEADFAQFKGEYAKRRNDGYLGYTTTYIGGDLQLVATLNNLKWNNEHRKLNLYAFGGVGGDIFTPDIDTMDALNNARFLNASSGLNAHVAGGVGAAIRISQNMNLALEYKVIVPFGNNGDFVDGYDPSIGRTSYRDIPQMGKIKLNFNLGTKSGKTEPLYWVNPMMAIQDNIAELQARPKLDLTDTDGDGVIDMLDKEKDTPAGSAVNVKGVALDSDGDGYADYKDKEPYSPPGFRVDGNGVAQVPKDPKLTEGDVTRIVDDKLKGFKPATGSLSDWFLPMIHFDNDKYGINRNEFEKLHYVANVLKNNSSVKVVVTGFTDQTASARYNNVLSYNRAKAAIDHLTSVYGISRDRLILNYNGENENLVPSNGNNFMNRRVEFRIAKNESDQGRPDGPNAGKPGYSGGKNSGY